MFSGTVGISRVKERFSIQIFSAFILTTVVKATRGGTKALEADGRKRPQASIAWKPSRAFLFFFTKVLYEDDVKQAHRDVDASTGFIPPCSTSLETLAASSFILRTAR